MIINSSHADTSVADGTVAITITSAQSQALTPGTYDLWIRVLDAGPEYSHLFRGETKMVIIDSPLSS